MENSKLDQFIDKLKEPSTIKGLVVLAGLAGVVIEPSMQEQIILGVTAVYGLIQIFGAKS